MSRHLRVVVTALGLLLLCFGSADAGYVQSGMLLVSFEAGFRPSKLPRERPAPIRVGFRGSFENLDASDTPALDTMVVQLARGGQVDSTGLPRCSMAQLRGRTSAEALAKCSTALVGRGTVESALRFPDGRRLRSTAQMLLFNSDGGIVMHIFTAEPLRGTFLVPISITHSGGSFGTVLRAKFPRIASGYGYLTGFSMVIDRRFSYRGKPRSYLQASCPAPAGFNRIAFELARVTYRFRDGTVLRNGTINSCQVKG